MTAAPNPSERPPGYKVNIPPPPPGFRPWPPLEPREGPKPVMPWPGPDAVEFEVRRWDTYGPAELNRELDHLRSRCPGSTVMLAFEAYHAVRVPEIERKYLQKNPENGHPKGT